MNVLLVSSNYSLPRSLVKHGLSAYDIGRVIYASEGSPGQIYDLLTTRWGVGTHLTTALIDRCGGHLYSIQQALYDLARHKPYAEVINPELYACVDRCLSAVNVINNSGTGIAGRQKATTSVTRRRMVRTLRNLAETGFCPVDCYDDPVVEMISRCNVGGVVRRDAHICGFDGETYDGAYGGDKKWKFGLVPTQQSMRLAIAYVLGCNGLL